MRLRLTGTDTECRAAVALAAGFALSEVSPFYLHRGASVLARVYVDANPLERGALDSAARDRTGDPS
ncbi:hypothetical protein [Pseudonocardia nigra]|uniref:hypothetical protein n=1 Tax=Pseudonocardia nigra TaxID=1921578 RepID=UPI001C5DC1B4|nr:hypothetical protein [Pseudonocardia nigra]